MFIKTYEHEKLKIKVKRCQWPEYIGTTQTTYHIYANGVDFISPVGLIFLGPNDYEVL